MLKRLRLKIVVSTMLLVSIVVVVAYCAFLAFDWNLRYNDSINDLERASEERPSPDLSYNIGRKTEVGLAGGQGPTSTGVFHPIVIYMVDESGNIVSSNEYLATLDSASRDEAISYALSSDEESGIFSSLEIFFHRGHLEDGVRVIAFSDASETIDSFSKMAIGLAAWCLILLICMFALSVLVARVATGPVEKAWEQQKTFIADASHELKTPLTVIIANTGIMRSHPEFTPEERKTWLDGTLEESGHMRGLIEDMLTLAREERQISTGSESLVDVDFSSIVERAMLAFDAVAFEAGVDAEYSVSPNIHVSGDAERLERLVKTLVDNAVKYAGDGGRVNVRLTEPRKGHPCLTVNNSGTVISKEDLPHVFDRFWRSDAARTRNSKGGYGLGLAIAKNIAQSHGAELAVASNETDGTTFTLSF